MAKTYPEDIENDEKATGGEKICFRFLKEAVRPHEDYVCWYAPPLGRFETRSTFILHGKRIGLLLLEERDWALHQIIAATPRRFTIRASEKERREENPAREAKGLLNALKERLGQFGIASEEIPMGRMVVFPHIKQQPYCSRGLQWLIPIERALFQDDLDPGGKVYGDQSGGKFLERIEGCLPSRFRGLPTSVLEKLHDAIWSHPRIELPQRQGLAKDNTQLEIQNLDKEQARLAMKLKRGHQVIKGPPGSGKTLLLVNRCCYLHKYHRQAKRILFLCYNITLVAYLKGLIREKKIETGGSGVRVRHFFELCSKILNEPVQYENQDNLYYDSVIRSSIERMREKGGIKPYDAIFIDEGQDFSKEMLEIPVSLLAKDGDLVIALDPTQDLYKRRTSWKSLGINVKGRTHNLRRVYRNTKEIFEFSQCFLNEKTKSVSPLALLPDDFTLQGEIPLLRQFGDLGEIEDYLVEDIWERVHGGGYKRSEIAIIYDDKVYGPGRFSYDNRAVPMRIFNRLENAGMPAKWVSQDARSKEGFDITTDRVSLISIHSSKGLDFDLVYLIGLDHIQPTAPLGKNMIALVYVAMSRAKQRLVIPYINNSEMIRKLTGCLPARSL